LKLWTGIKEQCWRIVAILIVGVLTVFADTIVGEIQIALHHADQQMEGYEELSEDLSRFAFHAEVLLTFFREGWTSRPALEETTGPYNDAVIALRCGELRNEVLIRRYWGERAEAEFQSVMARVREVEHHIRRLNPEYDAVIAGEKQYADPAITSPIVQDLQPAVEQLQAETTEFLHELL